MTPTERKTRINTFVSAARFLAPVFVVCALLVPGAHRTSAQYAPLPTASTGIRAAARYGALPLRFEPNLGQADPSVLYLAHGAGYTLFLTRTGAIVTFTSFQPRQLPQPGRSLDGRG